MKANKAPERIWIDNLDEGFWFDSPSGNKSIEYTRTDAFIEKTVEWIKENIINNPNANSVLVRNGCVTLGMLVDDFKKYMEGE